MERGGQRHGLRGGGDEYLVSLARLDALVAKAASAPTIKRQRKLAARARAGLHKLAGFIDHQPGSAIDPALADELTATIHAAEAGLET